MLSITIGSTGKVLFDKKILFNRAAFPKREGFFIAVK